MTREYKVSIHFQNCPDITFIAMIHDAYPPYTVEVVLDYGETRRLTMCDTIRECREYIKEWAKSRYNSEKITITKI